MDKSKTNYKGEFAIVSGALSGIEMELARVFAENRLNLLIEAVQIDLSTYEGVETLYQNIIAKNKPTHSITMNAGADGAKVHSIDTKPESVKH
jgi:short-subunit dehydrogenase